MASEKSAGTSGGVEESREKTPAERKGTTDTSESVNAFPHNTADSTQAQNQLAQSGSTTKNTTTNDERGNDLSAEDVGNTTRESPVEATPAATVDAENGSNGAIR